MNSVKNSPTPRQRRRSAADKSAKRMSEELSADSISSAHVRSLPSTILEEHTLFIADLLDRHTVDLLKESATKGLLKSPTRWILFLKQETIIKNHPSKEEYSVNETGATMNLKKRASTEQVQSLIEEKLSQVEITINSEVMIVTVDGDFCDAKMVYRFRAHLPLIFEPYCLWSSSGHFVDLRTDKVPSLRRRDLQKTTLTICTVLTDKNTVNHMGDYVDKHIDPMAKVTYHFTQHLAEFVNATPQLSLVDSWGYKQPNGSFNGLVGELGRGRADIAGSPLAMSMERMAWVEYVCVNTPMKAAFIFRKPPLSTIANIFALPFSAGVWASILLLILLVSGCILVAWSWEDTQMNTRRGHLVQGATDALLDSLCLVFQQGTWREPKFSSGRTVLLFGLVSFMFMFTAYSAYIVALLQSTTDDINTLSDLLESPLQLAVQDTLYNRFYFTTETEPVRKALWERKLLPKGDKQIFIPVTEGINLLRKGLYAFHVERTTAYDVVQKTFYEEEKCQFQEIEFLQITYPYFSIARDSPFKELFKIGARRMLESGLQSRSNRRILIEKPYCAGGGRGNFVSVNLGDCAPAMQCLACGCALAFTLLLIELAVHRRIKTRQMNEERLEQATEIE